MSKINDRKIMKKVLILAGVTATLASCDLGKSGYEITGETQGFANGTKVYISQQDPNNPMGLTKIDSTEIKDNKFVLKGDNVADVDIKYIEIGTGQQNVIPFVYENGKISVVYNSEKPQDAKVSGSKNNDYLQSYNGQVAPVHEKLRKFQEENLERIQKAQVSQNANELKAIEEEYTKLQDQLMSVTKDFAVKNKDSYISLVVLEQMGLSQAIPTEEFKKLFNELSEEVKTTKKGKEIAELLKKMDAVAIGQVAPDFKAKTPEGNEISLKQSLGKATLVDFWASWCGPCRKENPNVVKLYEKYKDKGLVILGVSLDKDAERWKKAIADDKLTWLHVSNLKQWDDEIAKLYSVSSIPSTFLLDKDGKIVAKDLRGEELEKVVEKLLQ